MNFFKSTKTRSPVEMVQALRENIKKLDQTGNAEAKRKVGDSPRLDPHHPVFHHGSHSGGTAAPGDPAQIKVARRHADEDQTNEDISRSLASLKLALSGEGEVPASPDVLAQVANEVYQSDLLSQLVANMPKFEFEAGHSFGSSLRLTKTGKKRHLQRLRLSPPQASRYSPAYRRVHHESQGHYLCCSRRASRSVTSSPS